VWVLYNRKINAEEIAKIGGQLHDRFALFVAELDNALASVENAKKNLSKARHKLDETNTDKSSIMSKVNELAKLGAKIAKNKKLPDDITSENDDSSLTKSA
jgi:DNA anti-recombination protein RmuC